MTESESDEMTGVCYAAPTGPRRRGSVGQLGKKLSVNWLERAVDEDREQF